MPLVPEPGPLRVLAAATLVNTVGNGMMFAAAALYFTRIVDLSAAQVGVGMSIAGLVGMLSGVPLGHLADRVGPREIQMVLVGVVAVLTLLYAVIESFWQFVAVAALIAAFDSGSRAARGALIARAVSHAERVHARAYLRAITNIGITIGAAAAGVALHIDTANAYKTLIVIDALTYALTVVISARITKVPPVHREEAASMLQGLRDRPYVAMVVVSGVLSIHFGIIEIGMPLWVVDHTDAPRSLVSILLIVNTVAVVCFQVRASRGIVTPSAAARAMALAGWVLLAACMLFAAADGVDGRVTIAILVAAALVHVFAEIIQSAGWFCLTMELAPDRAQGQYQGLAGTGLALSLTLAPAVVAFLPLGLGQVGWLILGVLFVMSGAALIPITRWAVATRGRYANMVATT